MMATANTAYQRSAAACLLMPGASATPRGRSVVRSSAASGFTPAESCELTFIGPSASGHLARQLPRGGDESVHVVQVVEQVRGDADGEVQPGRADDRDHHVPDRDVLLVVEAAHERVCL